MSEEKPRPADPTVSLSSDETLSDQRTNVGRSNEIRIHRKALHTSLANMKLRNSLVQVEWVKFIAHTIQC